MLDFIAVGPQRTASSWLDRVLRTHPRVILPSKVKETNFFDAHFARGIDWYLELFNEASDGATIRGEVGSTYFESTDARERIRNQNPNVQIIVMVRNPVARTFSSFRHEYTKGRTTESFFAAIDQAPRILDSGRYSVLAPEWELAFGCDNVRYIVQEDIVADPQGQMDAVFRFLGVEPIVLPVDLYGRYGEGTVPRFPRLATVASRSASVMRSAGFHWAVEAGKRIGLKRVYSGGNPNALSPSLRELHYLLREHEPDMEFLEARLGRTFPHWRDPAAYGA